MFCVSGGCAVQCFAVIRCCGLPTSVLSLRACVGGPVVVCVSACPSGRREFKRKMRKCENAEML